MIGKTGRVKYGTVSSKIASIVNTNQINGRRISVWRLNNLMVVIAVDTEEYANLARILVDV